MLLNDLLFINWLSTYIILVGINWAGQISSKPHFCISTFSLTLGYSTDTSNSTRPHLESLMTPQNVYLLLCFLALLFMPLFIYSHKPETYPINSFFFITSFPMVNLADPASVIFFNCVSWPMIISLFWLGLLFLSCFCCYSNLLMISNPFNSYSIHDHQRISPKMYVWPFCFL